MKFNSKTTKDMGDLLCGKNRRKPELEESELTLLMLVRKMYRAAQSVDSVCLVLPTGRTPAEVLKNYYPQVKNKLDSGFVRVVCYDSVTMEDLDLPCVVEM